jgi:hypothetical protein
VETTRAGSSFSASAEEAAKVLAVAGSWASASASAEEAAKVLAVAG